MNSRAILLMTAAMAAFAVSDALIKKVSDTLVVGQILTLSSLLSMLVFLPLIWRSGDRLFSPDIFDRAVVVRTAGEVIGSGGYVLALTLVPLTTASALMQAQPLAVTLCAALFLGEAVGWRRWTAVLLGCLGVLIILRPGMAGFDANALWTLVGIAGLSARDIGTRMLPDRISTPFVSAWALLLVGVLGVLITPLTGPWQPVTLGTFGWLIGISAAVCAAFAFINTALRLGEVSAIAPFRYTRIIFAIILAMIFFGERPDAATWIGTAIVIGSGVYAFSRERQLARR